MAWSSVRYLPGHFSTQTWTQMATYKTGTIIYMTDRKRTAVVMNLKRLADVISDLSGGTLKVKQDQRTGTFQDVKVEQKRLLPVVYDQ